MRPPPFIWKRLSSPLRQKIIRHSIRLGPYQNEISIKVAETKEELEAAFRLLYTAYVQQGIMEPVPSEMRCTIFQALPYTSTLIAKIKGEVAGTVAVIKDSTIGFPSDEPFRKENDHYRAQGFRLCEISALAIARAFRRNHQISLLLMKYLFFYATRYMNCDMLCATIHPRAYDFYAALFNFKRNGKVVQYDFANGALACHITLDAIHAQGYLEHIFSNHPPRTNLYQFAFEQEHPNLVFPDRKHACVLDPVMTPDLLKYFFVEKNPTFLEAAPEELSLIRSAWEMHFPVTDIPLLKDAVPTRNFRYPVSQPAVLLSSGQAVFGTLYDVSTGGAFFGTRDLITLQKQCAIVFNFGKHTFQIPAVVKWYHPGGRHQPQGFGISFLEENSELIRALQEIHLPEQAAAIPSKKKAA